MVLGNPVPLEKTAVTEMTSSEEEEEACNEGKHFFTNSEFCDRCNIDFDTHTVGQSIWTSIRVF